MTTARDLVQGAFEASRVYAPGEQALDADMARGFLLLNQMLDSWSNESLMCFAVKQQSVELQPGVFRYTIGTDGDIDDIRPIRIIIGPGAAFLKDSNNNQYPVDVVPQDKWNEIWNLESTNSNLPNTMFYDPQFPLGIINVNPVPNADNIFLFWNSYLQLTAFAALQTAVSLPPGYERMIQTNLALDLEPYFPTAVITPSLARTAAAAKGNIKRSNMRENIAEFDKVITQPYGAVYNPYSDSYR